MIRNIIIILDFLAFCGNLFLAGFVLKKNLSGKINRFFAIFAFATAVWVFSNFLSLVYPGEFLFRSTYALGSLMPFLALLFIYAYLQENFPAFIKISLGIGSIFFFIISFSPLLIKNFEELKGAGFEAKFGSLFILWVAFILLQVIIAFYMLIKGYFLSSGIKRLKIIYLLFGIGIMGIWATLISIILPMFNFFALSDTDAPSTILMVGFISYAIVKHKLLGVQVLISKILIFSLIIGALSGFLTGLIFLGAWFFSVLGITGVFLVSLLISFISYLIGKLFFKERQNLKLKTSELEKAKKELEKTKHILEFKVESRTKELRVLNENLENRVQEKTEELQNRIEELENFHRLTVGRELKMIELKKTIKGLENELKNK